MLPTGRVMRATRASVFAALCVLLTAGGHGLSSGDPVPWSTMAVAFIATGAGAWLLARRERGALTVIGAALAVQAALHAAFTLTQPAATPAPSAPDPYAREWADRLPSGPHHTGHAALSPPGTGHHLAHMANDAPHGGGWGMTAAHVAVALLSAVWLSGAERAAFRLLRAAALRVLAPVLRPPTPRPPLPHAAPVPRTAESRRAPQQSLFVRIVPSRGPPPAPAVA